MQLLENISQTPKTFTTANTEREKVLTSLELFAGTGGLALGTHMAGFKHLGLIEYNAFAAQTLQENSQRVLGIDPSLIFHCDVQAVDYTPFSNKVDLLTGGPPCQPFSNNGSSLGPNDPRDMFPAFLNTVTTIRPKARCHPESCVKSGTLRTDVL